MITALCILSALLAVSLVALVLLWVAYTARMVDLVECEAERLRLRRKLRDREELTEWESLTEEDKAQLRVWAKSGVK